MSDKQLIYNPFTEKDTKIDPYGRTAKKIYKYLIEQGAEADTVLPTDLTLVNGRFKTVKTIVDFDNVNRITYAQIPKDEDGSPQSMKYFHKLFHKYIGKTIRIRVKYLLPGGEDDLEVVEADTIEQIPKKYATWWKSFSSFLMIDSDTEIFGIENNNYTPSKQAQLLILTADKVEAENYRQYFLDGVNHCVFTPINEWAIIKEEDAKSATAKKRYKKIQKDIKKYLDIYDKGVPEEDIPEICNKLQIGIEIDIPSTINNDTKYIEYESQKKPLKKFKFVNTRLNHIELNQVNNTTDYIECNERQLLDMWAEAQTKGEFMMWKESMNGIVQINKLDAIYKLSDKVGYSAAVEEFEDNNNIRDYCIEHFANEKLSDWLLDNVQTNGSINMWEARDNYDDIEYDYENLNHIDIRKAYSRGMDCKFYKGYLGKITDFRSCDDIVGIGIYQIKNINFNGNTLIERMKILYDGASYPSPELEYYRSLGITFDIVLGCWGSSVDIDFGDDWESGMFEKEHGVAHYSKWTGCCMKLSKKDRYTFDCENLDFAKLNQYGNHDVDIRYGYEEYGIIEYQKKRAFHKAHITSFITSYCRLSMLEQLHKFNDINQIVAIVCDGIYYKGDVEVGELFSDKEQKSFNHCDFEYCQNSFGEIDPKELPKFRNNNRVELHTGAGGCGKTHYNLMDKGLVDVMFVAPSWKLARNKRIEYGVEPSTFFHLLSSDPDHWRRISRFYSTLVIDEVSMLSDEAKTKIIKRFKNHKIIFCGDIGFQLPPIEGSVFKPGALPIVQHKTNYRCQCKTLANILKNLRNNLASGVDTFNSDLDEYFGIKVIDKDSIDYSTNDLIITSTHKNKDAYTEKYKDLEKYSVLNNTRDYSNGDIIIGPKPKKVSCELRHAFTIHSIQGETATHKLFIDMNKMRDLKMFYTAISRAKFVHQIVLMR